MRRTLTSSQTFTAIWYLLNYAVGIISRDEYRRSVGAEICGLPVCVIMETGNGDLIPVPYIQTGDLCSSRAEINDERVFAVMEFSGAPEHVQEQIAEYISSWGDQQADEPGLDDGESITWIVNGMDVMLLKPTEQLTARVFIGHREFDPGGGGGGGVIIQLPPERPHLLH